MSYYRFFTTFTSTTTNWSFMLSAAFCSTPIQYNLETRTCMLRSFCYRKWNLIRMIRSKFLVSNLSLMHSASSNRLNSNATSFSILSKPFIYMFPTWALKNLNILGMSWQTVSIVISHLCWLKNIKILTKWFYVWNC